MWAAYMAVPWSAWDIDDISWVCRVHAEETHANERTHLGDEQWKSGAPQTVGRPRRGRIAQGRVAQNPQLGRLGKTLHQRTHYILLVRLTWGLCHTK